eukprot:gb/GECG01013121.1/.p1 GENE.gb/GECG01013121.1/~~gb/GECG01013121.1/.p1  ORF type:complete len:343 (+),score=42.46 gb/GECG01013121.1/:1-1029(+)
MRWRDLSRLFGGGRRHHRGRGFGRGGMMGGAGAHRHGYGGGGMTGPMAREGGDMDTTWMPFVMFLLIIAAILLKILLDKVNKNKNGGGSTGSTPSRSGRSVNTAPPQRLGTARERNATPQRRPWMTAGGVSAGTNDNIGNTTRSRGQLYPNVAEVDRNAEPVPPATVTGANTTVNQPPAVLEPPSESPNGGPRRRRKFDQLEEICAQKGNDYGSDYVDPTGRGNLHQYSDDHHVTPAVPYRVLGPPGEREIGDARPDRRDTTNATTGFGHPSTGYGTSGSGGFDKTAAQQTATYPVGPTAPVESDLEEEGESDGEQYEQTTESNRSRTASHSSEIDPEPDLR